MRGSIAEFLLTLASRILLLAQLDTQTEGLWFESLQWRFDIFVTHVVRLIKVTYSLGTYHWVDEIVYQGAFF